MQCIIPFLVAISFMVTAVNSRRVIRAAPGEDTTGNYIIVLKNTTSHENFKQIIDKVRKESTGHEINQHLEGQFSKHITAKLTHTAAHKVSTFIKTKLGYFIFIKRLKDIEEVEFIEEEMFASLGAISWAVDRVDQRETLLDNIYEPCRHGNGVDIYVLDTGINFHHCDFEGRAQYPGYDPIDAYFPNFPPQHGNDCEGHGTHVASLAVGKSFGIAKKATVYSVRVLGCNGNGPLSVVVNGMNYAAERIKANNRPGIISMSLGSPYSEFLDIATRNVVGQGIPVIVSAGNDRADACLKSPASTSDAITVAGTAEGDGVYWRTNGGSCVDIFAPGYCVIGANYLCTQCDCAVAKSGTSMSAPIVSGAVALMLQEEPDLTVAEITDRLKDDCTKDIINYRLLPAYLWPTTPNCLVYAYYCEDNVSSISEIMMESSSQMIFPSSSEISIINPTDCGYCIPIEVTTTISKPPFTIPCPPTPTPPCIPNPPCIPPGNSSSTIYTSFEMSSILTTSVITITVTSTVTMTTDGATSLESTSNIENTTSLLEESTSAININTTLPLVASVSLTDATLPVVSSSGIVIALIVVTLIVCTTCVIGVYIAAKKKNQKLNNSSPTGDVVANPVYEES